MRKLMTAQPRPRPAGKTTVASIYGAILRDLGLLSKGEVLVKVRALAVLSDAGCSASRVPVSPSQLCAFAEQHGLPHTSSGEGAARHIVLGPAHAATKVVVPDTSNSSSTDSTGGSSSSSSTVDAGLTDARADSPSTTPV
jgi:hypothetical protein